MSEKDEFKKLYQDLKGLVEKFKKQYNTLKKNPRRSLGQELLGKRKNKLEEDRKTFNSILIEIDRNLS
jgi:hypothetical protein